MGPMEMAVPRLEGDTILIDAGGEIYEFSMTVTEFSDLVLKQRGRMLFCERAQELAKPVIFDPSPQYRRVDVKESTLPGSKHRILHSLPNSCVQIHAEPGAHRLTGVHGGGVRVVYGKKTYLYTAYHVIEHLLSQDGVDTICLRANGNDVQMEKDLRFVAFSRALDFVVIDVPERAWSKLQVKAAKLAKNWPSGAAVRAIHCDGAGKASMAHGYLQSMEKGLLTHTASTRKGSSGFPLMNLGGNLVYGVHVSGASTLNKCSPAFFPFGGRRGASKKSADGVLESSRDDYPDDELIREFTYEEWKDIERYHIAREHLGEDDWDDFYDEQLGGDDPYANDFDNREEVADYYNALDDRYNEAILRFFGDRFVADRSGEMTGRESLNPAQYAASVLANRARHVYGFDEDEFESNGRTIIVHDSKISGDRALRRQENERMADIAAQRKALLRTRDQIASERRELERQTRSYRENLQRKREALKEAQIEAQRRLKELKEAKTAFLKEHEAKAAELDRAINAMSSSLPSESKDHTHEDFRRRLSPGQPEPESPVKGKKVTFQSQGQHDTKNSKPIETTQESTGSKAPPSSSEPKRPPLKHHSPGSETGKLPRRRKRRRAASNRKKQ
ncbi:hypothetical protein 1 [Beihai sobemo-like virus 1]|uniref:hypothetical protein 1 n=1 Tax=Beihai sobemo-like virus 1 TaxID=1922680 RepID=UPI00090C86E1|nr:hypothetical protein 1 [Beihai sobemo-like virus 1]APG75703.1 hypothetical protein 1 [Beihai sobemo-like virus 1]